MQKYSTARYCADPQALAAIKRDGLGWGHDLECGCFREAVHEPKRGRVARFFGSLKERA